MKALVLSCTVACISLCTAAGTGAQTAGATDPAAVGVEAVFWQTIQNSTNPAEFEAYLEQFPNGVFRALAQARLATLNTQAAGGTSPTSGTATSAAQTRDEQERSAPLDGLICDYMPGFPATLRHLENPAIPAVCFGEVYCSDRNSWIVACPANFDNGEYTCPRANRCSTTTWELKIEVAVRSRR